jgi:hypothetical protein
MGVLTVNFRTRTAGGPEWTLAFLTHCPQHQDEPLRHYCLCCHREEPQWIITREGKDEEVQCRHCGTALHHWPRENFERFSPSLQLMLRLESTLLRSLSGQAPDPFWVGNVDAETFANLVAELFSLLAEPDRQGVLALADHLGGEDWWDQHRLGLRCGNNRRQFATLGQSVEDGRFRGQVPPG